MRISTRPFFLGRSARGAGGDRPLGPAGLLPLVLLLWIPSVQVGDSVLGSLDLSADSGFQMVLPGPLLEVSGLATTPEGRLFAHNDERAVVYQIDPRNGALIKAFSVGFPPVSGDFEGMAIAGDRFFLATSGGELLEFREGGSGTTVDFRVHDTGLGTRCETEGLAFDPVDRALLMPCKTPRTPELENHLVVFSVPLSSMKPDLMPRIFLPLADLDANGLGKKFHPSAIEVHPETGSLLLVAAREEALVEVTRYGEILATRELKRKRHPQPEGLAFLSGGVLVMADEGQAGPGTLTRYAPAAPTGVGEDRMNGLRIPGIGGGS